MLQSKIMSETITNKPAPKSSAVGKFSKAQAQVNKIIAKLNRINEVDNIASAELAMSDLKTANEIEKAIEAKRTELVKPMNEKVKEINAFAKMLNADLAPAIEKVKGKVLAYQKEQERRALEQRSKDRSTQLLTLGMEAQDDGGYTYGTVHIAKSQIDGFTPDMWDGIYRQALADIQACKSRQLADRESDLELLAAFGSSEDAEALRQDIATIKESPVVETVSNVTGPIYTGVKGATKRWTFEVTDAARVPREYLAIDETKIRQAIMSGTREIAGVRIYQAEGLTIR